MDKEWINVKDRLPEDWERAITCDAHGNMHVKTHHHFYACPFGISPKDPRYYVVKWWHPLPEPPEGRVAE